MYEQTATGAAFLLGWTLSYRCAVDNHPQPKMPLLSLVRKGFNYLQVCTTYKVEADGCEAHLDALIDLKKYEAMPATEI